MQEIQPTRDCSKSQARKGQSVQRMSLIERAFSKVQVDNQGTKIIKLIVITMEEKSGKIFDLVWEAKAKDLGSKAERLNTSMRRWYKQS